MPLRKLFQKFVNNPTTIAFYALFGLLYLLLFLGDGKQMVTDIVGSAGIISLSVYIHLYVPRRRTVPLHLLGIWTIVIFYLSLNLTYSLSLGQSISSLQRYILAFVLFITFYRSSKKSDLLLFSTLIERFTLITILSSFILQIFPQALHMPKMNLLIHYSGHNHIANLLVLSFPYFFIPIITNPNRKSLLKLSIVIISLVLSVARAAVLLVFAYVGVILTVKKLKLQSSKPISIFVSLCILVSLASFLLVLSANPNARIFQGLDQTASAYKASPLTDMRLEYWSQAFTAFLSHPLLGNGLGTFHILSKQLQSAPSFFSWFAHNYYLQLLSETGLLGLLLVGTLLIMLIGSAQNSSHSQDPTGSMMKHSLALMALYALVDFNVEFLIIWILIVTQLSLLAAQTTSHASRSIASTVLYRGAIALLTIYFVSFSAGVILGIRGYHTYAYLIAPYDKHLAKSVVSSSEKDDTDTLHKLLPLIITFHGNDTDINRLIANYYVSIEQNIGYDYHLKAVALDPKNYSEINALFNTLLLNGADQLYIHKLLRVLDASHLSSEGYKQLGKILPSHLLRQAYTAENLVEVIASPDYYTNLYYRIGLDFIESYPQVVSEIWNLMYTQHPGWSNFYIDYASLLKYTLHDVDKAEEVLLTCQRHKDAGAHCREYSIQTLPMTSVSRKSINFFQK